MNAEPILQQALQCTTNISAYHQHTTAVPDHSEQHLSSAVSTAAGTRCYRQLLSGSCNSNALIKAAQACS
jgi:hypothetical protein